MGPIRKGKPSKHFLAWDGKRVRLIDFPSMVKSVRQSGKEVFKHAVLCRVCALLCAVLYAVRQIDKVSKLFVVVDGLRMFTVSCSPGDGESQGFSSAQLCQK